MVQRYFKQSLCYNLALLMLVEQLNTMNQLKEFGNH